MPFYVLESTSLTYLPAVLRHCSNLPRRFSITQCVICSGIAHFQLSGYVNKENYRYWAPQNPQHLYQRRLCSDKLTVWCEVASFAVLGSNFFEDN
jgi:hypothetical protein